MFDIINSIFCCSVIGSVSICVGVVSSSTGVFSFGCVTFCVVVATVLRDVGVARELARVAASAKLQIKKPNTNVIGISFFEKNLLSLFIRLYPFYFNRSHAVS